MTIFGRFNNSTCKSFESVRAGLFETWEFVIKIITWQ